MTEADVQKLREAGISDAVILDMQKEESAGGAPAPQRVGDNTYNDPDPNAPSTVYQRARQNGIPTQGQPQTWLQTATELAAVAKPVLGAAGEVATYAVPTYGVYKGAQIANAAIDYFANRGAAPGPVAPSGSPTNPIGAPSTATKIPITQGPSPIVNAQGQPMARPMAGPVSGPVVPAGTPAMAPQAAAGAGEASLIDKTTAMIRQLAANKVLGNIAKGGVGVGLAGYSGDTGPAVPSTGRLRGSELNPLTGAPWTREAIQQYEANTAMFDAQLPPPQFRR